MTTLSKAELEAELSEFGNANFDCGEWQYDGGGAAEAAAEYAKLSALCGEAKRKITTHIDALEASCADYREALGPFSRMADKFVAPYDKDYPDSLRLRDNEVLCFHNFITIGDCRKAQAALQSTAGESLLAELATLRTQLREAHEQRQRMEQQAEECDMALRDIIMLCGYSDPSDGEGTAPGEVTEAVRTTLATWQQMAERLAGILELCGENDVYFGLLRDNEAKAKELEKQGDMYGWNFFMGIAAGVRNRQIPLSCKVHKALADFQALKANVKVSV